MTNHQDKELSSERELFEHYLLTECMRDLQELSANEFGEYDDDEIEASWQTWKYRASSPQLPVAQMSGDARERFEREYLGGNKQTARRNERGDYVLPSIQDAWSGWDAASHPSNAAGQDAPVARKVTYVPKRGKASQITTWIPIDQPLPDHRELVEETLLYSAATVPKVVQAPAGWKLVPIEPTIEQISWGHKANGHVRGTYSTMIKHAPQPVAASPSIVPSDDDIAKIAIKHDHGPKEGWEFTDGELIAFAHELLTTASNAGEAAQGADK